MQLVQENAPLVLLPVSDGVAALRVICPVPANPPEVVIGPVEIAVAVLLDPATINTLPLVPVAEPALEVTVTELGTFMVPDLYEPASAIIVMLPPLLPAPVPALVSD